ncbi:TIM44-like domain-containing protein [Achromobacter sp. F4_2707]|uniref:Tim44 domain-containing protein n=1 Tax=Achromobacter sp. F4_2707 TaxID=3114286 RepID=UPI0039C7261C
MSQRRISRFFAMAILAVSAVSMLAMPFDAEARRAGGGKSFGMQSRNVTTQRAPATPPAATTNPTRSATAPASSAAAGAATAGAARSGMSRFLGPIAGIAAGLGIAALLSHLGLGGALLEFLSSAILIGLVVFAVMYLVRRLRGGARQPAMAQAGNNNSYRNADTGGSFQRQQPSAPVAPAAPAAAPVAAAPAVPAAPVDKSWFVPEDFDTPAFLANAKQQFIKIQGIWDRGDLDELRDYMTDDLIAEIKPELMGRGEDNHTEVVLLNAELLGIEQVSDGHLASVRYSGMLRENREGEAFRFEEVWNLYKGENAGWLLAGIQQIPVEYAS